MSDMNSRYARRLQKELMEIQKNPPVGIAVQEVTSLHKYEHLACHYSPMLAIIAAFMY